MDKAAVLSLVCASKIGCLVEERELWRHLWPLLAAWYQQQINHLIFVQANFESKPLVLYEHMTPICVVSRMHTNKAWLRRDVLPPAVLTNKRLKF
jgi:cAMP phosphodiesterase